MSAKYHTGLLATPREVEKLYLASLYEGASFIPDPTRRHYADKNAISTFSCYEKRRERTSFIVTSDARPCLELLIEAEDQEQATNDLSLLKAGLLLALPNPWNHYSGLHYPLEYLNEENPVLDSQPFWSQFTYENRLNVGLFTLNASRGRRNWRYALEKYRFSLELDCITAHSTHPKYGQIFENITSIARSQVNQLAAITSAYSVIEELGLEIRASKENPRFIGGDSEWNPKVWGDTKSRLIAAGVDVNKAFNWVLRGDPTAIHLNIANSFGTPSDYQNYKDVYDKDLHIIEAIQVASALRNLVASHTFKDISESVSPYDVFNVQSLARLLMMQTMGIWDYAIESPI